MPTPSPLPHTSPPRRPIRWWPVLIILLLAMGAALCVRFSYGRQRQDQNIAFANIAIISSLLLLFWCLFLSRLKWKIRLGVFAIVVLLVALMPVLFRIHGVTGDLVPILEWRWTRRTLAPLQGTAKPASSGARVNAGQLTND